MKSAVLTLGTACLLFLSACSVGSDEDTPTATLPPATAESTATATTEPTNAPTEDAMATATATSTEPAQTPTATATVEATSPPTGDGSPTPLALDPELAEEIADIEQRIVEIRGLEMLQPVPITVISRNELRENLIEDVQAEYSQEEADQDTLELWLLRLIDDPNLDLYEFQIDLLTEQILGYYDPESDEMYVVSDEDGLSPLAEFTLSHEMVHAAQDQHFDLMEVRFYDQGDNDRDSAAVALIEGDAEMAQMQYIETMSPDALLELVAEAQSLSSEVVDSAPPYLRESLYFPYEAGIAFVQTFYQEGGFDAIDEIFTDPPTSTEQILHPEKYRGERDEPRQVEVDDLTAALGDGWQEIDTDTLGEFDLSVMLRENGARNYEAAAAGWGGARYAFYTNDDALAVMAVESVWDTEAEATEFYDAMLATLDDPLDGEIGNAGQDRFMGLRISGDTVWFVTSADRTLVDTAMAGIGG